MDVDAIQRARARISAMRGGEATKADLTEVVTRARAEIEELSQATAELRASVPGRVSEGIREAIEAEVLPVARHIAEVRGLSSQMIRRLERTQSAVESEREARIDDLDVVVDLLVSSWQGIEARLARIEAKLDSTDLDTETRGDAATVAEGESADAAAGDVANGDAPLSAVSEPPPSSALG
ncbi:MAG: hypothetical protein ACR2OD_06310 [Gaiellaceae bacterium]